MSDGIVRMRRNIQRPPNPETWGRQFETTREEFEKLLKRKLFVEYVEEEEDEVDFGDFSPA